MAERLAVLGQVVRLRLVEQLAGGSATPYQESVFSFAKETRLESSLDGSFEATRMKFRPVLPRRFLGICGRKHSRLRVQTRARAVVWPDGSSGHTRRPPSPSES